MKSPAAAERDPILVRHCHGMGEFEGCIAIERAVWQSADIDLVPLPLFVVAAETGGQVLGAFCNSEMVGFTMAIAGWRNRQPFLHSHMTAVLESHRNRGIARRLKMFQREDALARGIALIEWTFDPLVLKNAHFNLLTLGAIARRYLPNIYGITTSPLHGALPTDRLVAEWHLRWPRVRRALVGEPRRPYSAKAARIAVPNDVEELKQTHPAQAAALQGRIREEFMRWLAKGYAVSGIEDAAGSTMDYILEPLAAVRARSPRRRP